MIWGLLVALLFAGHSNTMLIPKTEKYVKKFVVDKERVSEFRQTIKYVENNRKAYLKD